MEFITNSKNLLFSNPNFTILGFLSNLGIVTLTYLVIKLLTNYILLNLTEIYGFHLFTIIYPLLTLIIYKLILGKQENFNAGFILSTIFILLMILGNYLRLVL